MSNVEGILCGLLYSNFKGFETSKGQIAIESRWVGANCIGCKVYFIPVLPLLKDQHSHDDISMTSDELGDAVHRDISSKEKRWCDERSAERIVDNDFQIGVSLFNF